MGKSVGDYLFDHSSTNVKESRVALLFGQLVAEVLEQIVGIIGVRAWLLQLEFHVQIVTNS